MKTIVNNDLVTNSKVSNFAGTKKAQGIHLLLFDV